MSSAPATPSSSTSQSVREIIARWLFKEQWNFTAIPPQEDFYAYSHACLAGASGDGHLADAERDWIVGYFTTIGMPEEFIPAFQSAGAEALSRELVDRLEASRRTPA